MQRPTTALCRQEPTIHQGVWMVTCEYDRTVFGHIVDIGNINAAKKRIGDDTNKPMDKALKHVIDLGPRSNPLCGFGVGLSTRYSCYDAGT